MESTLHDFYIIVLEHIPPMDGESGTEWVKRTRPYEQWWIGFYETSALRHGWNVDHIKGLQG